MKTTTLEGLDANRASPSDELKAKNSNTKTIAETPNVFMKFTLGLYAVYIIAIAIKKGNAYPT